MGCMCFACTHARRWMCSRCLRRPEKALDSWNWFYRWAYGATWVLGPWPESSTRTESAFHHSAISPESESFQKILKKGPRLYWRRGGLARSPGYMMIDDMLTLLTSFQVQQRVANAHTTWAGRPDVGTGHDKAWVWHAWVSWGSGHSSVTKVIFTEKTDEPIVLLGQGKYKGCYCINQG